MPYKKGGGSVHSILTEENVREIIYKYHAGLGTHESLAEKYGVNPTAVTNVINRNSWKHLDLENEKQRGIRDKKTTPDKYPKAWGLKNEKLFIDSVVKNGAAYGLTVKQLLSKYIKTIEFRSDWSKERKFKTKLYATQYL